MKRTALAVLALTLGCTLTAQNLKKSITWENISAHPATLPVIGELKAVPSDLNRESCWSVGCETMDRDYAHYEKFKQYVGQTGVGYARLQSGWAKTEQKKGKYDFAWLDEHVDGLIASGVHPWLCLCYGNPIYSDHGLDLNAKLFPDGPIMDGWLKYVEATVKRYKGKVTMYEVWNEPDNTKNLDSYDLYGNLFARTAKKIKEIDPDVKVAAFGACTPERKYLRQAMKKIAEMDAFQYMDCLTYHAYWPIPEYINPYVEGLRKDVAGYSDKVQLLQGETGCPGQLEYGHAMNTIEWTEYSQAKWDLRNMVNHFGMGIPYSVFTMVDLNYGWMMQSYGLLRNNLHGDPIYLRPKFYAVQHVTSLLTPDLTPATDVTVESACGRKICCVGLQKDGKKVGCILWFGDRRPDSSLERQETALTIKGLQLEKPVYVDLLTGKVHSIPELERERHAIFEGNSSFYALPLWDCPIVLMNRNCVNF